MNVPPVTTNDTRPINVREFSSKAIGNGENADDAVTAARVQQRVSGRPLFFPRGAYQLTRTIEVLDNEGGDLQTIITGTNATYDRVGNFGSVLQWAGDEQPVIRVRSRGVAICNLAIEAAPGRTASAGIVWDKGTGAPTRLEVINVSIFGDYGHGGNVDIGILIGPTPGIFNMEFATIERVSCLWCTTAGLDIQSTTGQSKTHHIANSQFGISQYGIRTATGSFNGYNLNIGHNSIANLGIGATTDTIAIYGLNSEGATRMLYSYLGGSGTPFAILLSGGRWSLDDDSAEFYVDAGWLGPLIIENVLFEHAFATSTNPATKGRIRMGGTTGFGNQATLVSRGNYYLHDNPWACRAGGELYVTTLGDQRGNYTLDGGVYSTTSWSRIPSELDRLVEP